MFNMDMDKIFDHSYISQQAQQEHHKEQVKQVLDSVQKLKDFLDSTDSIEPQYQKMASNEFCAILFDYLKKHGKI